MIYFVFHLFSIVDLAHCHQMGQKLARWKQRLENLSKSEKENTEIKYQIPRLEIASIINNIITLKLKESDIDQKYQTSSIKKSSK
jgi:hypothetical protein